MLGAGLCCFKAREIESLSRSRLRLRAKEAGVHGSMQGRVAGTEPRAGGIAPEHGEYPPLASVLLVCWLSYQAMGASGA